MSQPLLTPLLSNTGTNDISSALGSQLVFLPLGLLVAALALDVVARARQSASLHRGVPVLLAIAAASTLIAVLVSGLLSDLPPSPFSTLPIGVAIAGLTLAALFFKQASLLAASANDKEPKPKRRGRGRGRRRASQGTTKFDRRALASVIYLVCLPVAIGLSIAAPLLNPQTQVEAEAPQEVEENQVTSKPVDPEPENETVSKTPSKPVPAPAVVKAPAPIPEPPKPEPVEAEPVEMAAVPPKPEPQPKAEELPAKPATKVAAKTRPVSRKRGGLAGADTFKQLIQPLFRSRCYSCHGEEKQKGELRLDTPEWIRKGGKSGPILIAGDPDRSYLQELISLDPSDDDIMPPKGKPLSAAQISWIGGWIREGAALGDGKEWPQPESSSAAAGSAASSGIAPPDQSVVQSLLDSGVSVRPVSADGGLVEIDFSHADRAAGDLRLADLAPIAANIQSLDLKRTKVSDADLSALSAMTNLQNLQLQRTKIGDAGIKHLVGLTKLESLNLYNTQVSDAAIPEMEKLTSLKKIYLWSSKVTPEGARKLAATLGSKVVNMGE